RRETYRTRGTRARTRPARYPLHPAGCAPANRPDYAPHRDAAAQTAQTSFAGSCKAWPSLQGRPTELDSATAEFIPVARAGINRAAPESSWHGREMAAQARGRGFHQGEWAYVSHVTS